MALRPRVRRAAIRQKNIIGWKRGRLLAQGGGGGDYTPSLDFSDARNSQYFLTSWRL